MIGNQQQQRFGISVNALILAAGVAVLLFISRFSFLLFHGITETLITIVMAATFLFAWNSRQLENDFLLFIGITFGAVATLGILHTFTYKGMGTSPSGSANIPTQLWIASRYLLSLSLLMAPFFLQRRLWRNTCLAGFMAITGVLVLVIFLGLFPDCYIEGQGLTRFKIISEYVICGILLVSTTMIYRNRERIGRPVLRLLTASYTLAIVAELAFTTYFGVYDLANVWGHVATLGSAYFFYKAVLETGISKPFRLLFRDLKEALAIQESLAKERSEALRHRDEFLSIASHELKTPITALRNYLQLIVRESRLRPEETLGSEAFQKKATSAVRQTERLITLIENLLNVSRIQNKQFHFEFDSCDLSQALRDLCARFEGEAKAAGVTLSCKVEDGVRGHWDQLRLEQLTSNLISNALRYGNHAPVEVSLRTEKSQAFLTVSDSGPGIPKEEQDRLFDCFAQGRSHRNRAGLGLGLFIVKQIVQGHQGTIRIQSEPGKGTSLTVALPLVRHLHPAAGHGSTQ